MRKTVFAFAGVLQLLCGGCIYSHTRSSQASVSTFADREEFPEAVWDRRADIWRQEFSAKADYYRSGIYDEPFKKLTPGGAHWGFVGGLIEVGAHLPTCLFELALMGGRVTKYDVVFLDRNTATERVELLALPTCEWDDRLLRQPAFRPYWTNEVFGIDFEAGERVLTEGRGGNARLHYLEDLSDNNPVLWWKSATGEERLVILQAERNAPKNKYGWRPVTGYRLLYFENFRFVRAIKIWDGGLPAVRLFDISMKDGRHVNVVNLFGYRRDYFEGFETKRVGVEWMVLQADLQTGETRTVGRYGEEPEGGKADGMEIIVTKRQ